MKLIISLFVFLSSITALASNISLKVCKLKSSYQISVIDKLIIKNTDFAYKREITSRTTLNPDNLDITYKNFLAKKSQLYSLVDIEKIMFKSDTHEDAELLILHSYDSHAIPKEDYSAILSFQSGSIILGRSSECE